MDSAAVAPAPKLAVAPGGRLRTVIVRVHAACLFLVTITAFTMINLGWGAGIGPYTILEKQPWGYIGLWQAYLLMFIIAATAWIGTVKLPGLRMWNALLLIAELVPFSVIFVAADVFVATNQQDKANLGIVIHTILTGLEVFALLWRVQSARSRWDAPGTP
jgi:hypothetical protein